MEMIIRKQIGRTSYAFSVSGANLFDMAIEAEKLSFGDVLKCGLCQSEDLRLKAYVTKEEGYKYVKILCGKCQGSITFGQVKKNPDTFYLRKTEDGKLDWQKHEEPANAGK